MTLSEFVRAAAGKLSPLDRLIEFETGLVEGWAIGAEQGIEPPLAADLPFETWQITFAFWNKMNPMAIPRPVATAINPPQASVAPTVRALGPPEWDPRAPTRARLILLGAIGPGKLAYWQWRYDVDTDTWVIRPGISTPVTRIFCRPYDGRATDDEIYALVHRRWGLNRERAQHFVNHQPGEKNV